MRTTASYFDKLIIQHNHIFCYRSCVLIGFDARRGSRYTWHGKFLCLGEAWNPYAETSRTIVAWMVYFPTVISNDQVQSLITCDFVLIEISFPLKFQVIRGWHRHLSNSEVCSSECSGMFEVRWINSSEFTSIIWISVSIPQNFHDKID